MLGKRGAQEPPKPPFKPTAEQARGFADRQVAKTQAAAQVVSTTVEAGAAVIRELVSAAKSNPVIGVALALITANILRKASIIDAKTEATIFTIATVAFGVTITLEVVEGIGAAINEIDPFSQGGATPPNPADLIRPSATTIVENPPVRGGGEGSGAQAASGAATLAALIPKAVPAAA
jgi:hypothetical protein